MLVYNHQARLNSCHDVPTFVLIVSGGNISGNVNRNGSVNGIIKKRSLIRFRFLRKSLIKFLPILRGFLSERIILRRSSNLRSSNRIVVDRTENRNLRFAFCVEVNLWYFTELSDSILDSCCKDLPDGLFIFELDFRLRRMDIHIDISRAHIEVYKIRYVRTYLYKSVIGLLDSFMEISMLHVTAVHEKVFVSTLLTCRLRFPSKTCNLTHSSLHTDRQ